jgi:hypothetical protein
MAFKGLHGTLTLMLRQFVQAISSQDAINTTLGYFDIVIAF